MSRPVVALTLSPLTPSLPVHPSTIPTSAGTAQWIDTFRSLQTAARQMRQRLATALRETRLSDAEFQLLWLCRDACDEGIVQTELSFHLNCSKAQTSGLVESLRRQGLLESHRSPQDRRRQLWKITPRGRFTLVQILQSLDAVVNAHDPHFSISDQQQLLGLLAKASFDESSTEPQVALDRTSPITLSTPSPQAANGRSLPNRGEASLTEWEAA